MRDPAAIYVGLMSGTSMDGISAAAARFDDDGNRIQHELLGYTHTPYDAAQSTRLGEATSAGTAEQYCRLNFELGEWLARAALDCMRAAGLSARDIRAIASHGQTLWHVPRVATWQAGEPAVIAERVGVQVVSDFRVRDVAAGGEGAPLVPIADAMLYSSKRDWRMLQNIGGIGNVTIVPPGGDPGAVRAFDTGPGMALIDTIVQQLFSSRGLRFDDAGEIARSGRVQHEVVRQLLRDDYFAKRPPKSTGREHFGAEYAARIIAACFAVAASDADAVATATALTAQSIARSYDAFVPEPAIDVIVSGGGTRNITLMRMLAGAVSPRRVLRFDDLYYNAEAKEAVAFALLAHLHLSGRPANVIGATGARGPRVLGKLTPA